MISGKIIAHNKLTKRASIQHVPNGCVIVDDTPTLWNVNDIIEWDDGKFEEQAFTNITQNTVDVIWVKCFYVSTGTSKLHTNCNNPLQFIKRKNAYPTLPNKIV